MALNKILGQPSEAHLIWAKNLGYRDADALSHITDVLFSKQTEERGRQCDHFSWVLIISEDLKE